MKMNTKKQAEGAEPNKQEWTTLRPPTPTGNNEQQKQNIKETNRMLRNRQRKQLMTMTTTSFHASTQYFPSFQMTQLP
jgi:polysaccharide pyruvyl transferase WcaK-like protein